MSSATHSGTLTVEGTTGAAATSVTVNGNPATLYSDNTFAEAGFTVTNGNNSFTAIASDSLGRHSTNTVSVNLPATNSYAYDLNGNLLYDGLRTFAYDDENQLTSVLVSNTWQSQFVYDGKMRRRIRKEYTWQSGAWVQTNEVHYIYDGTVVVQERDVNNLPRTTYTRGKDLSGSLQGAGGIGGLLAMSQPSTVNPQHYYYHADGNGNVTALVNAQQIIVAKYLYDPFGNALALSGPMASANVYRFSSKEYDQNSGLVHYPYRFYDPNLQRWLSRDPIQEAGGINVYRFVDNNPINYLDPIGLFASVMVIGNNVTIWIPIVYQGDGATADVISGYNSSIQSEWSGQFGQYNVTTIVTTPDPNTPANQINTIQVPAGNGDADCRHGNSGSWPALGPEDSPSWGPDWIAAHEAGHLMGLPDYYTRNDQDQTVPNPGYEHDIMGAWGQGVTTADITAIIQAHTR